MCLALTVGPLAGIAAQSASRWFAIFNTPLTGTYFRSVCGGFSGAMLKFMGYDAIVVNGRIKKPAYVWIHEEHVEFRDVTALGINYKWCKRTLT